MSLPSPRPWSTLGFGLLFAAAIPAAAQPPAAPDPTVAPAAAAAAAPSPAPAPSPPDPAPADPGVASQAREQALLHFEQGVALYAESNFKGALAEFEAAYKTLPAPSVLYNIGLTYRGLHRYPQAIDALGRYLRSDPPDPRLTPERKTEIEDSIKGMRALLAPVTFALKPGNARVLLDGYELTVPDSGIVELAAGEHLAEVSAEHHHPARKEFKVVAGMPLSLSIALKAVVRTGTAWITSSQPNTRIKIDGKELGFAPLKVELSVGGHQLEATVPKYEVFLTEVMLSPGQSRNIDIEMRLPATQPLYRKWWFWTAVGTAVASGTATAFMLRPGAAPPTVAGLGSSALNK